MPRKKKTPAKKAGSLDDLMNIPEVEEAIRLRLPILIARMFDLAEGVIMVSTSEDKETGEYVQRIYQTSPDRQALQFLIENVIGKTPQRVELTGKDGERLNITPWAPLDSMEAAGLLPAGGQIVEGVYSVIEDDKERARESA